jgi:FkbM family methyltransferase
MTRDRQFPALLRPPLRGLLKTWRRLGRAPGYLFWAVDSWGDRLGSGLMLGRLRNGCAIQCDLQDHIQRQMYFFGAYEPVAAYLFHALLRPGMIVIDAGANIGQYTLLAAKAVLPNGQVHAFEPVPANWARLTAHVAENGLAEGVRSNRLALWDTPKALTFYLSREDEIGNVTNYSAGTSGNAAAFVEADAVRLDDYVAEQGLPRVDLIKMDIEGAEWPALQGAQVTLGRHRPTLLMEINRKRSATLGYQPDLIWDFLRELGYSMWLIGDSPQSSGPLQTLRGVECANVFFHTRPLPADIVQGWSLHAILASFREKQPAKADRGT